MSPDALSEAEKARTARQIILPELGEAGQLRLAKATVAIVGAGGLGSPVIQYLAAAGVGKLIVIDDDVVELSNLHRQIIHGISQLGQPKTSSAVRSASKLSTACEVSEIRERLTRDNALQLLAGVDVIVDGSDSFDTRFDVNFAASQLGIPVVFGAVLRWDAQVTVLWPTPPEDSGFIAVDLADIFADNEQTRQTVSCSTAGVMGAVCGQAGSLMALETIKLITGVGTSLLGSMLVIDGLNAEVTKIPLTSHVASQSVKVEALQEIPPQAHVLDVRNDSERQAHPAPPKALHIPFEKILLMKQQSLAEITPDAELIVICAEGPRSARAARHLAKLGYNVVGYLDGGLR